MNNSIGLQIQTTYTSLPQEFFSNIQPDISNTSAQMVAFNLNLAEMLGLNFAHINEKEQAKFFSGQNIPKGIQPFAQAYAGHQFGHFTLLGDGRAVMLGEHIAPNHTRWDIQFKGLGPTPYARGGDGKAALGPMLREYVISEAMHHLGIPSSRSLAVVSTGATIQREKHLPGAILTRVSASHLRFGTFEFAATLDNKSALTALLDYTLNRHFLELESSENKALSFLESVMKKHIDLVVHWMRIGFIHGVMNTDNMSISGETLDYGPCAFLDTYDPETAFSAIDIHGRYAYGNQPHMVYWNLLRLAEALLPVIHPNIDQAIEMAKDLLSKFQPLYQKEWQSMMLNKLGLLDPHAGDLDLIQDLLSWMKDTQADFTHTFHQLTTNKLLIDHPDQIERLKHWHLRWEKRIQDQASSQLLMRKNNPQIIPRNHQVEKVIHAAYQNDLEPLHQLVDALKNPYQETKQTQIYQARPLPHERVHQTFCGT